MAIGHPVEMNFNRIYAIFYMLSEKKSAKENSMVLFGGWRVDNGHATA